MSPHLVCRRSQCVGEGRDPTQSKTQGQRGWNILHLYPQVRLYQILLTGHGVLQHLILISLCCLDYFQISNSQYNCNDNYVGQRIISFASVLLNHTVALLSPSSLFSPSPASLPSSLLIFFPPSLSSSSGGSGMDSTASGMLGKCYSLSYISSPCILTFGK